MQINGGVHSFYFRLGILFLGKFGPKCQNCQFKLTFGAYTNSSMKDSMVTFIFSIFGQKDSVLRQICSKKLKLFVEAKIWNLDKFQYAEFDYDFPSFHY